MCAVCLVIAQLLMCCPPSSFSSLLCSGPLISQMACKNSFVSKHFTASGCSAITSLLVTSRNGVWAQTLRHLILCDSHPVNVEFVSAVMIGLTENSILEHFARPLASDDDIEVSPSTHVNCCSDACCILLLDFLPHLRRSDSSR